MIRRWGLSAWAALLMLAAVYAVPAASAPKPAGPAVRVLVPAYFYPAGPGREAWDRLTAAASRAKIVAIANPATGPGKAADPNYRDVIERAVTAGVQVLGYVNTDYGRRPRAEAEADVKQWVALYPRIQGIFFDLQPSGPEKVDYHADLRKYVQSLIPKGLVVTNPGTTCAEEYVGRKATDVVCLFENREGFGQFQFPAWTARYPRSHFAVLAYRVKEPALMVRYVQRAVQGGAGYVYVTDADGDNPWDRLPAYWQEELAAVAKLRVR
jgi:hypothetical protein